MAVLSSVVQFFSNILCFRMKRQSVIQSRSEFSAIITAYVECLRYIIMKNVSHQDECEKLITTQLISVLDWCIINKNVSSKYLFTEIANLIQYWSKNSDSGEFANYQHYTSCFWKSIEYSFTKEVSVDEEILVPIAEKQVEFLFCLKRNNSLRKKGKVKFDIEAQPESGDQPVRINPVANMYLHDLYTLAYKLSDFYILLFTDKDYFRVIPIVLSVMQEFECIELFKFLNKKFTTADSNLGSLIDVYNNIFKMLLMNENTSSDAVVDIVFVLCKYLNHEDKYVVLSSLSELPVDGCLFWTAKRAIHYPYCEDATVREWLSTETLTNLLVRITSSMLTNDIRSDEMLFLKHALNQNSSGDIFVSETGCRNIISILCDALLSPREYPDSIEKCGSFAAYLASVIYTEKTLLKYGDQLVLALFAISCNHNFDADTISVDTLQEVNTAWQDVISIFVAKDSATSELHNLVWKLTKIIHNNFLNDNPDMKHLVAAIIDLIQTLISDNNIENISAVMNSVLVPPMQIRSTLSQIINLCVNAELVNGDVSWLDSCPLPANAIGNRVDNFEIIKYLKWYEIVIRVVGSFFLKSTNEEVHDDFENNVMDCLSESTDDINNLIMTSLYCYAAVKVFSTNFINTKISKEIQLSLPGMKEICLQFVNEIHQRPFYQALYDKIVTTNVNVLWAKLFYTLTQDFSITKTNNVTLYKNLTKSLPETFSLQLTQLFNADLSYEIVINATLRLQKFIIARSLIQQEENDIQIVEILTLLYSTKLNDDTVLLYNKNVSSSDWTSVQTSVEAMRLLTSIIRYKPLSMTQKYWDFFIVSLAAWSSSVEKSKNNYCNAGTAMFITAFTELFSTFSRYIKNLEAQSESQLESSVIDDYKKIFAEDINNVIINTWIYITGT